MSSGLIALLDDVVALAKVAAASLDDAAAQATKAGSKAAGIVIDDAAVTPRYVVGFAAERELPIIGKIALGSLKNKMLFLLPGALVLSFAAPWSITPLLMLGGAFLSYEGYEKVAELAGFGHGHAEADEAGKGELSLAEFEDEKVASAVRTDFILSAEIMAITLSGVASSPVATQATVLAVVGIGMTLLVYGAVAIIVKADDVGAAMARGGHAAWRAIGRGIVKGMPVFLKALSLLGMVAMLWVGGGILTHGLHALGVHAPEDFIKGIADAAGAGAGGAAGVIAWLVSAAMNAAVGLVAGAVVAAVAPRFIAPAFAALKALLPKKA